MANNKQAAGDQAQAGSASSKKLIFLVIGVALVAIVLSVGVTWFLLSGDSGSESEAKAAPVPAGPAKALYVELPPAFVITYNVNGRQRYVQLFITALARDHRAEALISQHLPMIRHQLNLLLGDKDFAGLQTDEGKQTLRQEATKTINQLLQKESPGVAIEQVLFTNFVMQ